MQYTVWTACFASASAHGSWKRRLCMKARSGLVAKCIGAHRSRSTCMIVSQAHCSIRCASPHHRRFPSCDLLHIDQHPSFPHAAPNSTPHADGLSCTSGLASAFTLSAKHPSTHHQHAAYSSAARKSAAPLHTSCARHVCQQCHGASPPAVPRGLKPCWCPSAMAPRRSRRWVSDVHAHAALMHDMMERSPW